MNEVNITKNKIFYAVLSIVSLGILLKTYDYLKLLDSCHCYNDIQVYNSLEVDINFLKAYQVYEMFLVVMLIVLIFSGHSAKLTNKRVANAFPFTFLIGATILLLTFVAGYITYNAFLLYLLSNEKCKCADKWQKYFIYVQGVMGSITFLRLVFLLLVVFFLSLATNQE